MSSPPLTWPSTASRSATGSSCSRSRAPSRCVPTACSAAASMDLKRLGSLLPKMPTASCREHARPHGGRRGRRTSGASRASRGLSTIAARRARRSRSGADIEAWCGKCGESTTHSIVAMVGVEPKQVLCQVCGSRHAYRTAPARPRAAKGEAGVAEGDSRPRVAVDPEAQRRAALLRALGEEVAAAADVRAFDPKERYKAGRDHLAPRVRQGQDRERAALEPARPLLGRRPQVADADVVALKRRRSPRGSA